LSGSQLIEFQNDFAVALAYEDFCSNNYSWNVQNDPHPYIINGISFDECVSNTITFRDENGIPIKTLEEAENILHKQPESSAFYKWAPVMMQDPRVTWNMPHWLNTVTNETFENKLLAQTLRDNNLLP
jgi:hypothetical protein